MGWFRKKSDPISERARALNEQIARLEAQIAELTDHQHSTSPSRKRTSPPRPADSQAPHRPATDISDTPTTSASDSNSPPSPQQFHYSFQESLDEDLTENLLEEDSLENLVDPPQSSPSAAVDPEPGQPSPTSPRRGEPSSPAAAPDKRSLSKTSPRNESSRPSAKKVPAPEALAKEEALVENSPRNPFKNPQNPSRPAKPETSRDLGVRRSDFATVWRRFKNNFRGPATSNPKLVNYLAAGSIQGLRPLRYEKRVARNRFILLLFCLIVVLWGIIAIVMNR